MSKIDELTLNRIVEEYLLVQKSAKLLAAENGVSAQTMRNLLRKRRVPIRSKVQQRRSDKVFGRYDQGEAIKKAWKRGCYETEYYKETHSGKRWIGADHSGQNNGFYGRTHSVLTRSRLANLARKRSIPGTGEYGPDWTPELRERIYKRDAYCCCLCENTGPKLQVHHIDGDRTNNEDTNLLTLCSPCHLAYHGRRENVEEVLAAGAELVRRTGSAQCSARARKGVI